MNGEELRLQRRLQKAWDAARSSARRIHQGFDVKPARSEQVFQTTPGTRPNSIDVTIKPVVFSVPERGDGNKQIYIAMDGRISFSFDRGEASSPNPLTQDFGTRVGYFRVKGDELVHVYGAHYDVDEQSPGHPIFHHQMSNMADMRKVVTDAFGLRVPNFKDLVQPILRNVRTPTAQMDGFSVLAQICADHLVHRGSTEDELSSFRALLRHCNAYRGIGHRVPFLNSGDAPVCFRSLHWYGEMTR